MPARPRASRRVSERALRLRRDAPARRPLLLRLAAGPPRASARTRRQPVHAGRARSSSALDVALELIEDEGLDDVFARHALLARATRAGVAGARASSSSATRTSAPPWSPRSSCPTTSTAARCPKLLRDSYGITANGGQDQLKGKILRIAHCGYFGAFDILTSLAGLEMALARARPRRRARRRRRAPRRRCSSRPASPAAGAERVRATEPYAHPRQGEDRRLRRRRCCASASTSTSASTGATTSSPSASAPTTGSSSARRPS